MSCEPEAEFQHFHQLLAALRLQAPQPSQSGEGHRGLLSHPVQEFNHVVLPLEKELRRDAIADRQCDHGPVVHMPWRVTATVRKCRRSSQADAQIR